MCRETRIRTVGVKDGSALWRLVRGTGTLELNSAYFYLTFAEFFGESCIVAERDGKVVGGVIAFIPPQRPDAIFVWQIGVAPEARRQGLAKRMLQELLKAPACSAVATLLATVTPSNEASMRTFHSLARDHGATLQQTDFFTSELFPEPHEAEEMISIGPLQNSTKLRAK